MAPKERAAVLKIVFVDKILLDNIFMGGYIIAMKLTIL
jgi:hypothetical protein